MCSASLNQRGQDARWALPSETHLDQG
uniref:Uncharacterized protein n=1 Tax=Anguilla anguilla TaxID=7936 RepID=A0A0E9PEL7_ANGAN